MTRPLEFRGIANTHQLRCATAVILTAIIASLLPLAATGEVYSDDFNRPDGPLGDPWIATSNSLYIASQRLVGNANEVTNMFRWTFFEASEAFIEFDLCFNGDEDDGRFYLYIGGGPDETSTWFLSGLVTPNELILRQGLPEVELATAYHSAASGDNLHLRLEYDGASGGVTLTLDNYTTSVVDQIDALVTVSGPFTLCAIGMENLADAAKWADNLFFYSDGRPAGVTDTGYEISGLGLVEGQTGFYMDYLASGGLVESGLFMAESGYLRMQAHAQTAGGDYISYPAGCYLTKLDAMTVGDSWQSYWNGIAQAEVAAYETLHSPAGSFDAFRVEYSGPMGLASVIWYARDVGFVRLGASVSDYQDIAAYGLAGGSGFLPLAVGNWWAAESVTDLDFGDAPADHTMPRYPTWLSQDGARHLIRGPWLGDATDAPDADTDGQDHAYARGDDEEIDAVVHDDEDGVVLPPFSPGETTPITVTVGGGGGVLEAWVDFDRDFAWDHPGEQIHAAWLDEGQHVIPVAAPADAELGNTFARFRISSAGGLPPTGEALDGEVEDHEVRILPDFVGKWEQFPDLSEYAMAVRNNWRMTADDFVCTETGPITEVGLWVAVRSDEMPAEGFETENLYWRLEFFANTTNIYTDQFVPYRPVDNLWEWVGSKDEIDAQEWTDGIDGFFYNPDADEPTYWSKAYYVRIRIPAAEAFVQTGSPEQPVIYWLHSWGRFGVPYDNSMPGWLVSTDHWSSPAVFYSSGSVQNWVPLWYPPDAAHAGQRIAFAFTINPGLDYGDAPGPEVGPGHPTLFARNGAGHFVTGPWLGGAGGAPDVDPDGQPDGYALGDDQDGFDDENGVQFADMAPGAVTTIDVQVGGEPGFVQGWVDWNRDQTWAPTEVVVNTQLAVGNHQFFFTVPDTAVEGASFARFRISRDGNLEPYGCARDGEVEDHRVAIGDISGLPVVGVLPERYRLHSASPNPFNPRTVIHFDLPEAAVVHLRIYDVAGRLVRTLVNGELTAAGRGEVVWQGRDEAGRRVATGVYFYRLEAGGYTETKRMVLVK